MSTLTYNEVVALLSDAGVARYSLVGLEDPFFYMRLAGKNGAGVATLSFDESRKLCAVAVDFGNFAEIRDVDARTAEASNRICGVRYGKYAISDTLLRFLKSHAKYADGVPRD